MAVSMVHEVAPQAKVVLVWPAAVVPIGGDARVEPAKILNDLGAAVTHVMAPVVALTETFEPPPWVAKVRKDPVVLRGLLAAKAVQEERQRHPPAAPEQAAPPHEPATPCGRWRGPPEKGSPRQSSSSRSAWRATISSRCWTSGAAGRRRSRGRAARGAVGVEPAPGHARAQWCRGRERPRARSRSRRGAGERHRDRGAGGRSRSEFPASSREAKAP